MIVENRGTALLLHIGRSDIALKAFPASFTVRRLTRRRFGDSGDMPYPHNWCEVVGFSCLFPVRTSGDTETAQVCFMFILNVKNFRIM